MEVQLEWSFPISIYYNTHLGQFVFLYPIPVYKRYSWGIATMIATPGVLVGGA